MNLFVAAGVDLPSSGPGGKRALPRLPRSALIAERAYEQALTLKAVVPTTEQVELARKYARRAQSAAFRKQKETQVRNTFFDEVLIGILGFSRFSADSEYSLAFEHRLRTKPVDVALGRFFPDGAHDHVVAPFEVKGPDSVDLDKIMPGRGISPVQQAWDYAADAYVFLVNKNVWNSFSAADREIIAASAQEAANEHTQSSWRKPAPLHATDTASCSAIRPPR